MKSYLISDNKDTWVGMKLAGIDGVIVHTREEALKEIKAATQRKDIGILILTEVIAEKVKTEVMSMKLELKRPLIVEIPDRHAGPGFQVNITRYIEESIGVKL